MLRRIALLAVLSLASLATGWAGEPREAVFRTGFEAGEDELHAWDTDGGWVVRVEGGSGALFCESGRVGVAVWYRAPVSKRLRVEASLIVSARAGRRAGGGWAAAGLCVWSDGDNYWRLALVESPAGERYAELVEMRAGRWQAQTEDGLERTVAEGTALRWRTGVPYRLVLELDGRTIQGSVVDPDSGKVLARIGYRVDTRPAVTKGRVALHQVAISARWDDISARCERSVGIKAAIGIEVRRGPAGAAAVLDQTGLGADPEAIGLWKSVLEELGFGVTVLPPELAAQSGPRRRPHHAARPGVLSPENFDFTVIPDVHPRPEGLAEAVHEYLLSGGKALVCGGPAFGHPFWKLPEGADGRWIDEGAYAAAVRDVSKTRPLVTFDDERELDSWTTGGSDPGSTPRATVAHGRLRLEFADYSGWGHCLRSWPTPPFPSGHTLTVFRAKGGPATKEMIVEWKEKDGSRWIARVDLSPSDSLEGWKRHVLTPEDFAYWPDSESVGRGGAGDRLRPEEAGTLSFGIARSHCRGLGRGRHVVWIDEVATAASPLERPPAFDRRPEIELFSPPYKTYVMRDVERLRTAPAFRAGYLDLPEVGDCSPPRGGFSPVTRFRGRGFARRSRYRWVPCLDGFDREGRCRGSLVSVLVHWRAPFHGSVWGYLGTASPDFAAQEPVRRLVSETIRRIAGGVFLVEGGTTEFVYHRGEAVTIGVRAVNFGKKTFRGEAVVEVLAPSGDVLSADSFALTLEPGDVRQNSRERRVPPTEGLYRVRTRLLTEEGRREIDRIEHTFQFAPDLSRDEFVRVRGGDFRLGRERWFPVGINFWPRYCAGLSTRQYQAHWLDPAYYDPDVVDEDLAQLAALRHAQDGDTELVEGVAALGTTMVSVSCSDPDEGRNLNDFLLRCRRHGLRVNLFVGGLDPLHGGPERGLDLIRRFGLVDNPIVFAYDIAWEPRFFGRGKRFSWGRFDAAWREWLADRYGSVETAERVWGSPAPLEDGLVVTPSFAEFRGRAASGPSDVARHRGQGDHSRMIAAFHRFFYDHVGERYARVIRRIREVDPNHLISFRGQACAVPSKRGLWPMHSPGAMKATDFVSPEGYGLMTRGAGRKAPWEDIRRGGLTTVYLREASGGKPVFWSEFGAVLYPNGTRWTDALLELPDERYAFQVAELTDWARMLVESGANGATPWWFPGGFRVNEGSDWGLFHPDGTPRPCAGVLGEIARTISIPRRDPRSRIEFDFDAHVFDSWEHYGDEYLGRIRQYHAAGVRLAGAGTDSTNCPDLAVGNVPWRGVGPAKYLNAMFEEARVRVGRGPAAVWRGGPIGAKPGDRVALTVIAANTAPAEWADSKAARGKPGAVELVVEAGALTKTVPIARRVPYLGEITIGPVVIERLPAGVDGLRLRMRAAGRGAFGSALRIPVRRAKP